MYRRGKCPCDGRCNILTAMVGLLLLLLLLQGALLCCKVCVGCPLQQQALLQRRHQAALRPAAMCTSTWANEPHDAVRARQRPSTICPRTCSCFACVRRRFTACRGAARPFRQPAKRNSCIQAYRSHVDTRMARQTPDGTGDQPAQQGFAGSTVLAD